MRLHRCQMPAQMDPSFAQLAKAELADGDELAARPDGSLCRDVEDVDRVREELAVQRELPAHDHVGDDHDRLGAADAHVHGPGWLADGCDDSQRRAWPRNRSDSPPPPVYPCPSASSTRCCSHLAPGDGSCGSAGDADGAPSSSSGDDDAVATCSYRSCVYLCSRHIDQR